MRTLCLMLLLVSAISADETTDVLSDRNNFPRQHWPQLYYFTLANIPEADRLRTQRALDFIVASTTQQVVIEKSLPDRVNGTLFRIDIAQLGWEALPHILKEHYPYARSGVVPVVIRADWFIDFVTDQTQSTAYLQLLDGTPPKNTADLLARFKADDSTLTMHWIEDASRVAVNKTRLLKSIPTTLRGDLWVTFDFRNVNPANDPLQNIGKPLKGSFSEYISPLPKVSITNGEQGHLQRYALTNAEGKIAPSAPIDVVIDHTPLGPQLINPRSCMACHKEGLRMPSINSLRRYLDSASLATKPKQRDLIERQFLTQLQQSIEIHNQKYAQTVKIITGGTTEEISADVVASILAYREPVDFARAALELGVTEERLASSLSGGGNIPARLAQLPRVPMSRDNWEAIYPLAIDVVQSVLEIKDHATSPAQPVDQPKPATVQQSVKPVPQPAVRAPTNSRYRYRRPGLFRRWRR